MPHEVQRVNNNTHQTRMKRQSSRRASWKASKANSFLEQTAAEATVHSGEGSAETDGANSRAAESEPDVAESEAEDTQRVTCMYVIN